MLRPCQYLKRRIFITKEDGKRPWIRKRKKKQDLSRGTRESGRVGIALALALAGLIGAWSSTVHLTHESFIHVVVVDRPRRKGKKKRATPAIDPACRVAVAAAAGKRPHASARSHARRWWPCMNHDVIGLVEKERKKERYSIDKRSWPIDRECPVIVGDDLISIDRSILHACVCACLQWGLSQFCTCSSCHWHVGPVHLSVAATGCVVLQRIHTRVLEAVAQMYDLIIVEKFIENFKFKISFLYFACFWIEKLPVNSTKLNSGRKNTI